ncbi:MAG: DnaJ domain-containing protein, partial [Promicromonosporaceae bacterium]|nr:DnaJ domain-containing protein [Promicromonosporaceae bacterium]
MASQDWIEKDFYKELGVEKTADDAAIKKAYRKLARKYHPDQNAGDNKAETKFKAVTEAYSVLSDSAQRKEYDQIRAYAGGGARFMPGSGGASGMGGYEDLFGGMFGGGGGSRRQTSGSNMFGGMNLDDLFGYGGTSFDNQFNRYEDQIRGQGYGRTTMNRPGEDINAEITLPFRTAIEGDTVEMTIDGKNLKTRVPAGTKDGATLKLRGKGYPSPGDGPNGDLLLTVHVGPHPVYSLSGRNLKITVPISF